MTKENKEQQLETAIPPVVAFNRLVAKNLEYAFNMQIASLQAYARLGMDNINAGLEVRNADGLKAYIENQKSVAQEVTNRAATDVKAYGELSAKFIEDARALSEESMKVAKAA